MSTMGDSSSSASLARHVNHLASLLVPKPSASSAPSTVVSAYGVVHALSMLIPGAGPSTASHAALLRTLYGGLDEASAQKAIKELSTSLQSILEEANAAFVASSLPIQDSYREALEGSYDAEIRPLESATVVNNWIAEKTHEKITSIIDDSVAAQAALILINAIYFKESWEHEFDPRDTNQMPFTRLDGSSVTADMMYMKYEKTGTTFMSGWEFETADGVECVAARLRYHGGRVSAVFARPKGAEDAGGGGEVRGAGEAKNAGDGNYEERLVSCQEAVLHQRPAWRVVDKRAGGYQAGKIFLPRFEAEIEHGLTTVLKSDRLGLGSIFEPGDFVRIGDSRLAVSDVKQKVFLKVDETGTEAAAVTAVIALRMMPLRPVDELFILLDKPFYFGIVDEATGLHVFSGVISL